ncbi:MAG: hypothetical protein ACIAQZ_12745 [Sedimentisphaeraceae bacterium JB056]
MNVGGYPVTGVTSGTTVVKRESVATKESIKRLAKKLDKVLLINEAMWEILRDEHGYTDEKLKKKIREVDLRDGVEDGKNQPREALTCPSCGRNSLRRNRNCMYCGTEINTSLFSV